MEYLLNELELNVCTLNYMSEDYGQLVDVAIEEILIIINVLRHENYELALHLSRVFSGEDFWEQRKQYAYQNYLEVLMENNS